MFWNRSPWLLRWLLAIFLALSVSQSTYAVEPPISQQAEAWLVTYGPGDIYWQRFGHNAIWIRNPELGLDHTFNFGFFDFEQKNFFLRFLQGRMLYFSAAQAVQDEFSAYINENREIRVQRLNLSVQQLAGLTTFLLHESRPENRDYLYDYYLNNCSTRIRDALDQALGGELSKQYEQAQAPQTWRDHTRRLTFDDFWMYLGLEVGLGSPVDRRISKWEEMFIPEKLAEAVSGLSVQRDWGAEPLVLEDAVLHESSLPAPPARPPTAWPRYLLASIAALALAWLSCRWVSPALLARMWLILGGLFGAVLLFLWFGTDHAAARLNLNLLVFNPLWLIPALWKGKERLALVVPGGISILALLMVFLPPDQYNLDVLAAFLPLNVVATLVLFRARPAAA